MKCDDEVSGGGIQLHPTGDPNHHIVPEQPEIDRLHRRQRALGKDEPAHPYRLEKLQALLAVEHRKLLSLRHEPSPQH